MTTLTTTQLKVLRKLKRGPHNAIELGCSVSTLIALQRLGMVWVQTTFNSFAYPRKALAWIQNPGRAAVAVLKDHRESGQNRGK